MSSTLRTASRTTADRSYVTGRSASSSADPGQNRKDFLHYALSLMRAHNGEHSDSLPVLDVSALKHIAYVFDALIYYMRSGTEEIAGAGRRAEDPATANIEHHFLVTSGSGPGLPSEPEPEAGLTEPE